MIGVLEPGEARVCQVSFQAGLQPQLFSGEIFCHAAEARAASPYCSQPRASAAAPAGLLGGVGTQGLTLEQWQTLGSEDHAGVTDEEIIAQHPPR